MSSPHLTSATSAVDFLYSQQGKYALLECDSLPLNMDVKTRFIARTKSYTANVQLDSCHQLQ